MTDDSTAPAQEKHKGLIPWKPGQSGNPKGREKGSRNKLSEDFLTDTLAEWRKSGKAALAIMAQEKPSDFCKMVAQVIPKEFIFSEDKSEFDVFLESLDYEQLRNFSATLALFAKSTGQTGETGTGTELSPVH